MQKIYFLAMILICAGLVPSAWAAESGSQSHAVDLRDFQGEFVREYREVSSQAVKTQNVRMDLSYDESGNQVLSFQWQSGGRAYPATLVSNPSTGLFQWSGVLSYAPECNSLTARVSRIEPKRVFYQCSIYYPDGKPYSAGQIRVVDDQTLELTYSQSKCLVNLGGHLGCWIWGGMVPVWTETLRRK